MSDHNLIDSFGRDLKYLRLSITKKCNFKCLYCLPNGYDKESIVNELSVEEVYNLLVALCDLGIEKVRLTGGEPTLHPNFFELVGKIKHISNLKNLCLTTNGHSLKKNAKRYLEHGISCINVSVDTLQKNTFQQLTGSIILERILDGIYECLNLGFEKVKINAVLLKSYNYQDIDSYLEFIRHNNVHIRFISLMPISDNMDFYKQEYISTDQLVNYFKNNNWQPTQKSVTDGPAITFSHNDYKGKIGVINPYSNTFCQSCNRLRVDSHGKLLMCLLNLGSYDLRPLLQSSEQKEELKNYIIKILQYKPEKNLLNQDFKVISNQNFSKIGG